MKKNYIIDHTEILVVKVKGMHFLNYLFFLLPASLFLLSSLGLAYSGLVLFYLDPQPLLSLQGDAAVLASYTVTSAFLSVLSLLISSNSGWVAGLKKSC